MRLTLFRPSPGEGWPSIDRYAEGLAGALPACLPAGWRASMPMPPAPWKLPYGQLLSRAVIYPAWARRQQGDLNHILDHTYAGLLTALPIARTLLTIHDIAPLHFPGRRLGLATLLWRMAWRNARRARYVVADSSFIAAEIRPLISAARIWVVPQAVAAHFRRLPAAQRAAARTHYVSAGETLLLHVGNTAERKNLPALFRALAVLRAQGRRIVLMQVGGRPTPAQRALLAKLDLTDAVRFVGSLPEDELVKAYNAADVFVFPSLYEGFGFPALEALACGTPVVAGAATSLPEVVGDAGLLADPRSPQALGDAIARFLDEPALARELSARGQARASEFTWERCAQRYVDIYQAIWAEAAGEQER